MDKLLRVLAALDHDNDDDWTADGLPRVDRVNELSGEVFNRQQITEAAPMFVRGSVLNEPQTEAPKPWDKPQEVVAPKEPEAVATGVDEDADIMSLPLIEILSSLPLAQRAVKELSDSISKKTAEIDALSVELDQLHQSNEIISKFISSVPVENTFARDIAKYQETASASRQLRADRAKKFIDANTSPKEVAKQLRVASPLDDAMKKRKSQTPALIKR